MTIDPELVRAGRRLRDRLAELGAEAERVQADLRRQVGLMRAAGGSPAEIAAAVGLGEDQVRELLRAADGAAVVGDAVAARLEELDEAEDVDLGGPSREAATGWVTLSCAFCGASQENVGKLIAGPGVAICDGCARLALDLLVAGESDGGSLRLVGGDPRDRFRCSFCGKRSRRVGHLVTGSGGVNICGECLDLCNEILREEFGR